MRFLHPELLWLLTLLPLLALASWWSARRGRAALQRFSGGTESLDRFVSQVSSHRRFLKTLLIGIGLASLICAAARPQWGTRLEEVTQRGIDLVVVLDTSLSMAAEDMAPSRLGQARHEVDSLLETVEGNRVGLITFAGQATLDSPLTLDHTAVRLFLDAVEVETVQVPGTALADALKLAVRAFRGQVEGGETRSRALVLFTDGEDHEGGLDEVISELDDEGIAVYAVGCGTTRGAPIPLRDDAGRPTGSYKKDGEGRVVTTRLDETVLERLALDTGGRYYRATPGEAEVVEIANALAQLDAQEFGSVLRTRYEERFQLPLFLGLLALFVETLIGDRNKRRRPTSMSPEVS